MQAQGTQLIQAADGQTYIYCPVQQAEGTNNNEPTSVVGFIPLASWVTASVTMPQQGSKSIVVQCCEIPTAPMPPEPQYMEVGERPFYVNPKQYHRILKRRQARARLIADGRIPQGRTKYLYESRHKHAMNRVRSDKGRFHSGPNRKGAQQNHSVNQAEAEYVDVEELNDSQDSGPLDCSTG